jgi:hypothetical protein
MTRDQLTVVLETITGQLQATSSQQEKQLQSAMQKIASSVLKGQEEDAGTDQLFVNSDLYSRERISASHVKNIADIAAEIIKTGPSRETITGEQFFIRTTPVLNPQVAGSMPEWAIGAKPFETFGPFINNEGREIWIDFYRIEKLITLYIGAQPVLLFKASFRQGQILIPGGLPVELTTNYNIVAGSFWIHAKLLSASAPADKFVGVEVKSGTVKLSEPPVIQNNHLVINAATTIQIALQLVQGKDDHASETSAYGKDARDATYQLPEVWEFSIQNNKTTISKISPSSAEIFGQSIHFDFTPANNLSVEYNSGRVLIPWKADADEFTFSKSVSPWAVFSGKASLKKSCWALPAASLNIVNPIQASGNGAVWLEMDKGIIGSWTGLENEEARLMKPVLLGEPGQITLVDLAAELLGASQHFDLWKDKEDSFPSTADLIYQDEVPFFFISYSKGTELLGTSADATIHADRPVKVNGEALPIHTISCNVMLSAAAEKRNMFLLEDIVEDIKGVTGSTSVLGDTNNNFLRKESIALENALFTVSPVAAFILFGECDEQWKKVTRANFFLSFFLYGYLPTLPDPYVGNLGRWRILFERLNRSGRMNTGMSLIGAVRYIQIDNDSDDITVSFHFGGQTLANFMELPENPDEETPAPVEPAQPAEPAQPVVQPTRMIAGRTARFGVIRTAARLSINELARTAIEIPGRVFEPAQPVSEPVLNDGIAEGLLHPQQFETGSTVIQNLENSWDESLRLNNEYFSLLDVSSNANQLGISFGTEMVVIKTGNIRSTVDGQNMVEYNQFPFIVEGMQVKLPAHNVRAFTLPLMAWEPEINLTPPDRDTPNGPKLAMDPEAGFLYYANDGGPSRIWNNNIKPVPLAPLPVVSGLIEDFKSQPGNYAIAALTLPFGMKALGYISKHFVEPATDKPSIENIRPLFKKENGGDHKLEGGNQLSLRAGKFGKPNPANPQEFDSPLFPGYTIQTNNLLDWIGKPSFASNLGHRVTEIFNNEFVFAPLKTPGLKMSRGVPVSRIDITGYGANMFSNWLSPGAAIAQTSQARFDVMLGRTGHEVIQVKSILYPWGIRVVRTITVFRTASGYVFRTDSGWKAESDGKFDFSFKVLKKGIDPFKPDLNVNDFIDIFPPYDTSPPYEFHPGVIRGLFNVRNIKDAPSVTEYESKNTIQNGTDYINGVKGQIYTATNTFDETVKCGGVYFDADIEIENVVQGSIDGVKEINLGGGKKAKYGRVVSKRILGYVQTAPAGKPLTAVQLKELLQLQNGSIGGDLDCEVNISNSNQQMHINRFDVSASVAATGTNPVFVVAARGQVFLPKDGSWALVQHNAGSGEVTQLPTGVTVPLIRAGEWIKDSVINPAAVKDSLARIAHPMEILRPPGNTTINFGYLQITATQKALFLTPAYGLDIQKLLSKTPPVFADAYRLMTGNSIFPNIGNAIDNFGKAMPMANVIDNAGNAVKAFTDNVLEDGGEKVLELMDVLSKKTADTVVEQGMKLLQKKVADKALEFEIPQLSEPIYLVKTDALKIYIEYKAKPKDKANLPGKLDFDVDSFINDQEKQWRSRMNNVSMVVDLSDMKRIMTIKGNFDSKKGKESNYEGGPDNGSSGLPTPEIEFSDALQPVIDILEVLAKLSSGDYAGAMKKGLKLAMSNAGEIWEYKFEASKEIPLVRFPPTDELYNSAQTPLKLEASLGLGVYFNAALKVTTDPTQLLPTAGAFLQFHGGLSVMCFSVGVGTIYAVGSVDVKIAADTKVGPSLALKFGFGVQLVVSLPVVGSVSVTYMVGVEMYADKTKVIVAALMLFRGHASLIGGLVCVTITIEAKGIIERDIASEETNCSAQVTFALDISIFLVIDISFSKTWGETRQIA